MYALLPFTLRNHLSNRQLLRALTRCDCDACTGFWKAHHFSCCDCRNCRRYARNQGECLLCGVNDGRANPGLLGDD